MSEMAGIELDRAVGFANGWTVGDEDPFSGGRWMLPDGTPGMLVAVYKPSSNWAYCGPLIEAAKIDLMWWGSKGQPHEWEAQTNSTPSHYIDQYPGDAVGGDSPMEAICRAYVEAKGGAKK